MTSVAPAYLAPTWRYAGDDWEGANALTFPVWATPPVYAADGVTITTPGIPRDLTGCTVEGILRLQSRCVAPAPTITSLPILSGAISGDPKAGMIALSLSKTQTAAFPRQDYTAWSDPRRAALLVQPMVLDANGDVVTVGLQQLFVF